MTLQSIHIQYQSYEKGVELGKEQLNVLHQSIKAAEKAYAVYSEFRVGAAVELENRSIVLGCNQENASYPCGLCAERVALFNVGINFHKQKIKRIAVSVLNELPESMWPPSPCGACRQVMSEFEYNNLDPIEIILGHPNHRTFVFSSVLDLLPFSFHPKILML
ncbi:MAG: cytidine deaminase [Bacteroidota bacterium]|nr:cytidine deaminase [Bacteroidota bacterium]